MASFNKVVLMGNVTRDIDLRYTPSGKAVCELGLAVNRTWFDKSAQEKREEVTFVDVTLWGRQAEVAGEYLSKGRGVLIEGRLQLDQWTDKDTGQKRSKLRVVGENMTMLPGRNDRDSSTTSPQSQSAESSYDPTENQKSLQPEPTFATQGDALFDNDNVPF